MQVVDIAYEADGARLLGQFAVDDSRPGKRPGILVCHEGNGPTDPNPSIDAPGLKSFSYHEASDWRSRNAMLELFNETLQ